MGKVKSALEIAGTFIILAVLFSQVGFSLLDSITTITVSPASPSVYNTATNFSCINNESLPVSMFINDVNKTEENNLMVTRAAGAYTIDCNFSEDATYSDSLAIEVPYSITNASASVSIIVTPSSPINYGTESNFTCKTNISGLAATMLVNGSNKDDENGVNVVRAVDSYNISCQFAGNDNYSSATSVEQAYTVNKTTPTLAVTVTTPIIYGAGAGYTAFESNSGDGGCIYALNRNGSEIAVGSSVSDNTVLAVGTYIYNYFTIGCANYTSGSDVKYLTVGKATLTGALASTAGWGYAYGLPTTISLTETNTGDSDVTYVIYRDTTNIGTGETKTFAVGAYDYVLNSTGGANYSASASIETQTLTVTKAPTSVQWLTNPATPITYGALSNFSCAVNTTGLTATMLVNGSNKDSENGVDVLRAAGSYNLTCQFAGNDNYSAAVQNETAYTVNTAPQIMTLVSSAGNSFTYGTETTITPQTQRAL